MALPKGKPLGLVQTRGLQRGSYDLFNLEGLSWGKVMAIKNALSQWRTPVGEEIIQVLDRLPENQTSSD